MIFLRGSIASVLGAIALGASAQTFVFDPVAQFSSTMNPNGNWRYVGLDGSGFTTLNPVHGEWRSVQNNSAVGAQNFTSGPLLGNWAYLRNSLASTTPVMRWIADRNYDRVSLNLDVFHVAAIGSTFWIGRNLATTSSVIATPVSPFEMGGWRNVSVVQDLGPMTAGQSIDLLLTASSRNQGSDAYFRGSITGEVNSAAEPVPEPATLALAAGGLAAAVRRRRARRA